jgi:HK97 family phage major capsid protein
VRHRGRFAGRLRESSRGLVKALERELFYGDGTAAHLHGIAQESGVQVVAFADDIFTVTRRAITSVTSLGYNPSVFVVGPADLETIDLATTSGSGEFVNKAGPFDPATAKLWGVPVVVSTSLDPGEAYLLSDDSVKIYADQGARIRVEWARTGDDFETNAVRARLEGRFEIGVSRPEGVVKIDTAAA